jgi:hypothetical protein
MEPKESWRERHAEREKALSKGTLGESRLAV